MTASPLPRRIAHRDLAETWIETDGRAWILLNLPQNDEAPQDALTIEHARDLVEQIADLIGKHGDDL